MRMPRRRKKGIEWALEYLASAIEIVEKDIRILGMVVNVEGANGRSIELEWNGEWFVEISPDQSTTN